MQHQHGRSQTTSFTDQNSKATQSRLETTLFGTQTTSFFCTYNDITAIPRGALLWRLGKHLHGGDQWDHGAGEDSCSTAWIYFWIYQRVDHESRKAEHGEINRILDKNN